MKRFFGFVKKEFFHIIRDPRTLVILFGIPIVEIMLFGYVITNELKDIPVAVLDKSGDEVTVEIQNKIYSSGFFLRGGNLYSEKEIEKAFRKGHIKQVIVFEADFSEKLEKEGTAHIELITDASDANTASMIVSYTNAIIQDYMSYRNRQLQMPLQINVETRMQYNPELKGSYMFVPGTMALILMLISAMMTSISIAREKELGTMEILLVSPLNPLQIVLGKVAPYFGLSIINAITIVTLGNLVFGVPINGSIVLLMTLVMLFILMALSLGLLISTVAKSQQQAMFLSMFVLMLPTILLSGFIFPIENMPWLLQVLANIMPPKYFIIILKNIMLKGTGFEYVWKETLILIGMTIIFIGLSVKKFKIRLE